MKTCMCSLQDHMVQKNQRFTADGSDPRPPPHWLERHTIHQRWQELGGSLERSGGDRLKVWQVWSADIHEVRAVTSDNTDL